MKKILVVNVETGAEIEREMNSDEIAQAEMDEAASIAEAEQIIQVATAKAALLKKLGITEEEAKLLLG